MGFLLKCEKIYQNLAKNQLKFLPHSPAEKLHLRKILNKIRHTEISSQVSDNIVKQAIEFYSKNHERLGDTQDIYKLMFTFECIRQTEHLQGDIIELGGYKGGNAIMMAWFLQQIKSDKKIICCDTFEGTPDKDEGVKNELGKGLCSDTSYDHVKQKISEFKMDDKITLIKGKFQETLSAIHDKKFSLVFLDCTIYNAAKYGIEFTYPRLVDDGVMISHCYAVRKPDEDKSVVTPWGETIAVNEFLKDKIEKVEINSIPFFQKGRETPIIKNSMPKNIHSTYDAKLMN